VTPSAPAEILQRAEDACTKNTKDLAPSGIPGTTRFAVEHQDTQGRRSSPPLEASSPAEDKPRTSAKDVLGLRDFRLLWFGQVISSIGDGLTVFALMILVQKLTGSTAAVATMAIVIAVPQVAVGLLAGVFVDRWEHRRTMIGADLLRAVIVFGFTLVHDASHIWLFYVIGFAQATVGTFFTPARTAIIPQLVPREGLIAANSLIQTTRFLTRVIGEALAGVLIAVAGSGWLAFSADALTFVVSALFLVRMVVRPRQSSSHPAPKVGGTLEQLAQGLRVIRAQRALASSMAVIASMTLGVGAVLVLSVPYLVKVQGVRTELLGVMGGAEVIGMLLGTGLVTIFASRLDPRPVIVIGVCAIGVLLAGIGAAPSITWVLAGAFLIGMFAAPIDACVDTVVQSLVPADARGRVSSAMNTVFTLASLFSMVAGGVLGDRLGLRNVFYAAGAITLLSGVGVAPFMLARGPLIRTTHIDPSTR
jgi:DHA3 family macrolide efflux protein-like MFS transporter